MFESLTLAPFFIEILGVKNGYFNVFSGVFSVRFSLESGKMCKNTSTFFIFTFFFADIPCFFFYSRARSTPGEGGTGKYRPPYQPAYQPST